MNLKIDHTKSHEAKKQKQLDRSAKIQKAISSGVPTTNITTSISYADQETIIILTSDGTAIIDTTIPRDLNKCLDRNYPITSLTLYNSRPVGASFSVSSKKISFRS